MTPVESSSENPRQKYLEDAQGYLVRPLRVDWGYGNQIDAQYQQAFQLTDPSEALADIFCMFDGQKEGGRKITQRELVDRFVEGVTKYPHMHNQPVQTQGKLGQAQEMARHLLRVSTGAGTFGEVRQLQTYIERLTWDEKGENKDRRQFLEDARPFVSAMNRALTERTGFYETHINWCNPNEDKKTLADMNRKLGFWSGDSQVPEPWTCTETLSGYMRWVADIKKGRQQRPPELTPELEERIEKLHARLEKIKQEYGDYYEPVTYSPKTVNKDSYFVEFSLEEKLDFMEEQLDHLEVFTKRRDTAKKEETKKADEERQTREKGGKAVALAKEFDEKEKEFKPFEDKEGDKNMNNERAKAEEVQWKANYAKEVVSGLKENLGRILVYKTTKFQSTYKTEASRAAEQELAGLIELRDKKTASEKIQWEALPKKVEKPGFYANPDSNLSAITKARGEQDARLATLQRLHAEARRKTEDSVAAYEDIVAKLEKFSVNVRELPEKPLGKKEAFLQDLRKLVDML